MPNKRLDFFLFGTNDVEISVVMPRNDRVLKQLPFIMKRSNCSEHNILRLDSFIELVARIPPNVLTRYFKKEAHPINTF